MTRDDCLAEADEAFMKGFLLAEGDSSGGRPNITLAAFAWAAERLASRRPSWSGGTRVAEPA